MARLCPLDECLETTGGILFDTTSLVDLFRYEEGKGQPSPLLLRIAPMRRYTSVINAFEFICNRSAEDVKNRRAWLDDKEIRSLPVTGEVCTTFQNLIGPVVGCHLLRDLIVAATAKTKRLAVASGDNDFEEIDGLLWVEEFRGQA